MMCRPVISVYYLCYWRLVVRLLIQWSLFDIVGFVTKGAGRGGSICESIVEICSINKTFPTPLLGSP